MYWQTCGNVSLLSKTESDAPAHVQLHIVTTSTSVHVVRLDCAITITACLAYTHKMIKIHQVERESKKLLSCILSSGCRRRRLRCWLNLQNHDSYCWKHGSKQLSRGCCTYKTDKKNTWLPTAGSRLWYACVHAHTSVSIFCRTSCLPQGTGRVYLRACLFCSWQKRKG